MYRLNSALTCLVRGAWQPLFEPLTAGCRTVRGNSGFLRPLSTSAESGQEAALQPQEAKPTTPERQSEDLSSLPDQDDTLTSWGGQTFEELPIVHIKATYNNTHIQVTDHKGKSLVRTSCGTEGFRNIKKSTPVAAQTAGITAAAKAQAKGVTFVRVVVSGLGQGRLSSIKGLSMKGLKIVSITDNTPVPHNGCRPRKARKM
ncbi:small ribosomal subunit protein uS11m [Salminus brasiliensis]|uniref:small ribosomal subunit protein uS11m n=1 Tax=Salminus brasiliensis TaxID=930266 RepID=UPI003B82D467